MGNQEETKNITNLLEFQGNFFQMLSDDSLVIRNKVGEVNIHGIAAQILWILANASRNKVDRETVTDGLLKIAERVPKGLSVLSEAGDNDIKESPSGAVIICGPKGTVFLEPDIGRPLRAIMGACPGTMSWEIAVQHVSSYFSRL